MSENNSIDKKSINNIKNEISIFQNKNIFGFWIYLMSDCILFATLFSVYCVMCNSIVSYHGIFNLNVVFLETIILLLSSFFYGLLVIFAFSKKMFFVYFFLLLTLICGIFFIAIEGWEFNNLIKLGYNPQNNAFFSSFFTLVGMHGIHVIFGLLWLMGIFFQLITLDLNKKMYIKILCLGIFWHFLDIIWVCLFTIVYLIGSI